MGSPSVVCGLDIGGTKIRAVAFDPDAPAGHRLGRRGPTPPNGDDLLRAVSELVGGLTDAAADEGGTLSAVGVGIAGLVDRSGRLIFSPNLAGLLDVPIAERLQAEVGLPTVVENDAAAAAWGEHLAGAGRGVDEVLLVTLGTGIGAGVVSGGRLVVGANGFAGEVGHVVVDPDGPPCPCGRRGCWERYASGSGLGRLGREAAGAGRLRRLVEAVGGDPEAVRGEHVTTACEDGDPEALAVLDQFAWWVGLGLANLTNVLDPEVIVVGGGLISVGELLLDRVRAAHHELLYSSDRRPPTRIEAAVLGEDAGAIGAGLLAAAAAALR